MHSPYWKTLAPPVGWMIVIAAVSSVPGSSSADAAGLLDWVPPSWQNALHLPVYALLGFLWMDALASFGCRRSVAGITAAVIATSYGIVDEVHQYFVPGRTASITDALVNAVGASLVLLYVRDRRR